MLIYEYLPHELAQLGVISKASGLDRHQAAAGVRLAQERAGRARVRADEPHRLSERWIAESRRLQWKRIAAVMEGGQLAAYAPSRDSRAARCEGQHLQRLMPDVAGAERAGDSAPEISRHRVCGIDARPAANRSCPAVAALGVRLVAASSDDAAERAWVLHGREGGLYRRGGYRISFVQHVLPGRGELF